MLDAIAFDADDTLWHCGAGFSRAAARWRDLLADHAGPEGLEARLLEVERRNLKAYGFGVKAFTLSMVETAIEVTEGRVPGPVIAEILAAGREMLEAPVELIPEADGVLRTLRGLRLVVITKGDLLDQERKLAASGLSGHFEAVEIVSAKTPETYARAFARMGVEPARAMMVGDSMRSDVRPAIAAGAWGVHVPHEIEWEIERAAPPEHPRFVRIRSLADLPHVVGAVLSQSLK